MLRDGERAGPREIERERKRWRGKGGKSVSFDVDMVVAGVDLFVLRQLRQHFLGWRVWISGERERYSHTVWGRRIEDSNEMNMALWEKESDWRTDLAMAHFEYVNCPLFPWALTTYTYTFNFPELLIINAYRAAYNKYKVKDPLVQHPLFQKSRGVHSTMKEFLILSWCSHDCFLYDFSYNTVGKETWRRKWEWKQVLFWLPGC